MKNPYACPRCEGSLKITRYTTIVVDLQLFDDSVLRGWLTPVIHVEDVGVFHPSGRIDWRETGRVTSIGDQQVVPASNSPTGVGIRRVAGAAEVCADEVALTCGTCEWTAASDVDPPNERTRELLLHVGFSRAGAPADDAPRSLEAR